MSRLVVAPELDESTPAPQFYIWEAPGKPAAIHLHYDVMDRLRLEAMRGLGLAPKRGVEVGGLLLGTVEEGETLTVHIHDFEPVPCSHSRGPSYVLSDSDLNKFEEALARWRPEEGRPIYAVGFYRSHTREGLELAEEDLALLARCLPRPSDVALLVKPFATRSSIGGFFFRENGGFQTGASYREFPLQRELAEAERPPVVSEVVPEVTQQSVQPSPSRRARRSAWTGWLWVPLAIAFLLLAAVAGYQAFTTMRRPNPDPPTIDPYVLELTATPSGENLHVKWNRQAPAVRLAKRGVLSIVDGNYHKTLELDSGQLQNGSVIYRRMSGLVAFRLEVFPADRTSVSETLEIRTTQ